MISDYGRGAPGQETSTLCAKVALLVTEDWFVLSHFRPLIAVLREIAGEVVVITRSSGRAGEIEALGARVVAFDYQRASSNPAEQAKSAWALSRVLAAEKPDYVLILPWNLKEEVIAQLGYVRSWGGKFVTAVPTLTVD